MEYKVTRRNIVIAGTLEQERKSRLSTGQFLFSCRPSFLVLFLSLLHLLSAPLSVVGGTLGTFGAGASSSAGKTFCTPLLSQ